MREISVNIRRNLEKMAGEEEKEKGNLETKPMRIAARKLVIKGVTFHMRRADGSSVSGTLPTIRLDDVGGREGKTPAGLGTIVALSMAREMFKHLAAKRLKAIGNRIRLDLEEVDSKAILALLRKKITLSDETWQRVIPVIEQAGKDLRETVRDIQENGFLNLESLTEKFEVTAAMVHARFDDFLSNADLMQIKVVFVSHAHDMLERIRGELAVELTRYLGLTPDQIKDLLPELKEDVRKRYKLIPVMAKNPDRPFEDFIRKYETLQKDTRQMLGKKITPEAKALKKRQEELLDIIREVYLGIANPGVQDVLKRKM